MTSAEQAEKIFTQVFLNLTRRHSDMLTFRRLADLGKPAAISTLHDEQLELAQDILTNPAYDEVFKDRKAAVEFFGGPAKMAVMTAAQEIQKYSRIVDAASLVFLHSAVDASVSDLCRVTLLLDPASWESYVLSQTVTLGEAKMVGVASLTSGKLDGHLKSLERQSISKRIERLFAVCKPEDDFAPVGGGFKFDLERLGRLDEQRHNVVHGEGYRDFEGLLNEDLEFLVKSGLFLVSMVNMRYEVKINPLYAVGIELSEVKPL